MGNKTKEDRLKTVNEIIKVIALNGRNFFLNNKDNDMAYFILENGRLFMHNEYNKSKMYLHTKFGYPPKNWHHGGTLWGLTKDFKEFIQKGGDTNHNNGYGGLYCTHWGYKKEEMELIHAKAKELNYLKS